MAGNNADVATSRAAATAAAQEAANTTPAQPKVGSNHTPDSPLFHIFLNQLSSLAANE